VPSSLTARNIFVLRSPRLIRTFEGLSRLYALCPEFFVSLILRPTHTLNFTRDACLTNLVETASPGDKMIHSVPLLRVYPETALSRNRLNFESSVLSRVGEGISFARECKAMSQELQARKVYKTDLTDAQ
jgi:hypothetical protein